MEGSFESMETPAIELQNLRNAFQDNRETIAQLTLDLAEAKSLCLRAADALEGTLPEKITLENADFYSEAEKARSYLIAELRKAAE